MSSQWTAVVTVQMPSAGSTWVDGKGYVPVTMGAQRTIGVPDVGGFYGTRSALESSLGSGSVYALFPKS